MAALDQTPGANRIHIAFFGLRNAGKSTLVNEFTGQNLAIVSDVAGTTTDPVSKAMEILPLGPCLVTDTAGLDDTGELGRMRVEKTLAVLKTTDIAVWVGDGKTQEFIDECARRNVAVLDFRRGDSASALKEKIAAVKIAETPRALLEGIAGRGDRIVCVCPIDESAPKGRIILPQVQLIRECLDIGAVATVCQPLELHDVLRTGPCSLVVTDSQAFAAVRDVLLRFENPPRLTSFSILYARQKGNLDEYGKGVERIAGLNPGSCVLVAEGCTHHRQCNDIGTVKLPKALEKLSGAKLEFAFASGADFLKAQGPRPDLIVQCGGCMLTRREVLRRIDLARENNIPITNYGMVLAAASGIRIKKGTVEVQI